MEGLKTIEKAIKEKGGSALQSEVYRHLDDQTLNYSTYTWRVNKLIRLGRIKRTKTLNGHVITHQNVLELIEKKQ